MECSICLQVIDPRGGKPLAIPGCCGGTFHQQCLLGIIIKTKSPSCPLCRALLPSSLIQLVHEMKTQRNIDHNDYSKFPDEKVDLPPSISTSSSSSASSNSATAPASSTTPTLELTFTKEFDSVPCLTVDKLYSSVGIKYREPETVMQSRTPIDVCCILDNSTSMRGNKLQELKKAMNFVIATLNQYDRLSIVEFNTFASVKQGLIRMNDANKSSSNLKVEQLSTNGGTNIYSGMVAGREIMSRRTSKNPTSCVFLLTDGQDGSNLAEKINIAKSFSSGGTSLFVFGFGADHDSSHLTAIAHAAEGSFIYIDTNDTVIDAFGGAIGSQMNRIAYNVSVNIKVPDNMPEVQIKKIQTGYKVNTVVAKKSFDINFSNLFSGEFRDILIEMCLPPSEPAENYPIIEAFAKYEVNAASESESRVSIQVPTSTCFVKRDAQIQKIDVEKRNIEMELKIQRLECTEIIKKSVALADNGLYDDARMMLNNRLTLLNSSPWNKREEILSLISDIKVSLQNCERGSYRSGGKAVMMSALSVNTLQRKVYSQTPTDFLGRTPSIYQGILSSVMQSQAAQSKKTFNSSSKIAAESSNNNASNDNSNSFKFLDVKGVAPKTRAKATAEGIGKDKTKGKRKINETSTNISVNTPAPLHIKESAVTKVDSNSSKTNPEENSSSEAGLRRSKRLKK